MASTYTSRLKLERQASGENSGNWGNLVNYVLNRIDSTVRGYTAVDVAGSANVTLTSNTSTTNTDDDATDDQVHNKVIEFTGALTGAIHVFTDAVEGDYTLFNNTSGSYSLTFANTGHAANGVAITQGTKSIVYTDGSTIYDVGADLGAVGTSSLTVAGAANVGSLTSTGNVNLLAASSLVLQDSSGGEYAALKASATTTSYTLTLPAATGSADQVLTTNGSGVLSFVDNTGGTSWVAVKTAGFTAVAGEGYFCDTTLAAFTMTLPAGTLGDEISFIDYAGTFDTYALTIAPDGAEKIQGTAASLTVSVERAANTLVYTDGTQGWLLKAK
jgi:hypothetical protein